MSSNATLLFTDLTPEEKIAKAKIKLLREKPFFGYILMNLKYVASNTNGTFRINKKGVVKYNRNIVEHLSLEGVMVRIAHEGLHWVLKHVHRMIDLYKKEKASISYSKHRAIMNIAMDAVVNTILALNGFDMPKDTIPVTDTISFVIMPKVWPVQDYSSGRWYIKITDANGRKYTIWDPDKKSAEEIYWELRNAGFDPEEEFWTDYSYDEFDPDDYEDSDDNETCSSNSRGCECGSSLDLDKENDSNIDPAEILTKAYIYAKMHGHTPLGVERYVNEILKPKIPWKAELKQYLTKMIPYDYDFRIPHKKSALVGVIYPSIVKGLHLDALVAVDTSGSITDEELAKFLGGIKELTEEIPSFRITLVSCDATIQTEEEIWNRYQAEKHKPKGGGGTDFRPVFELAIRKRARLVIYFTDGCGTFPETAPPIPVIWVVSSQGAPESHFPFGKVIRIN